MYSKTPTGREYQRYSTLIVIQGRLRIKFWMNGQQKAFSLGLAPLRIQAKGESIARQMHMDMQAALIASLDSTNLRLI